MPNPTLHRLKVEWKYLDKTFYAATLPFLAGAAALVYYEQPMWAIVLSNGTLGVTTVGLAVNEYAGKQARKELKIQENQRGWERLEQIVDS